MQFHIGAIPSSPDFEPGEEWSKVKEPSAGRMQLYALPIALLSGLVTGILWFAYTPLEWENGSGLFGSSLSWADCAALFILNIVVHEFVHAMAHPSQGRSSSSVLGCWPAKLLFYAHYTGELSRNRFLVILLLPLLVISGGPLLIAIALQSAPDWLAYVSILNAFLSAGDLFGSGIVLRQIPGTATVRNQGYFTFWKTPDQAVQTAT
ncbi:MAG: DUF3267 domain-containing protein [Gammaproteobacteria bacterium]|nr:DUF3267 domain-containing protein [Gammaproteobacteria bacterium]MYL00920.1 DUF3267 domain-containing protein [Gammaproteobacteria bacterium]